MIKMVTQYEAHLKKCVEECGYDYVSFVRQCRLGSRIELPTGEILRYGKIDFGSAGIINGKRMRIIMYRWIIVPL